jgi:riboflavin kinase / FMN adenylyltransferase
MIIIHDLNQCDTRFTRPVITIGNFDGVHLGHQTLFRRLRERAQALQAPSVVLTFDPHPIKVMAPERQLPLLTTTSQKIKLLSTLGLDAVIVHPFTRDFAALPAREFVEEYLCRRLGVQEVVVGHDYSFGRNREGKISLLREMGLQKGFPVHVVDAIQINSTVVSSTLIRRLIQEGQVEKAEQLLGHPYEVTGVVVHGHGRGARLLGIATANLRPDNDLLPAPGIYAVRAKHLGKSYSAVANLGTCPTFEANEVSLEVHLMDFHEDIYDSHLDVEFVQRLRSECRFPDLPALVKQIEADILQARHILN